MSVIYKCKIDSDDSDILEILRSKIANVAGVSLVGNRLTIRWSEEGELVNVHLIIDSVKTPEECRIERRKYDRTKLALDKDKKLRSDLDLIEYGCYSK